MRSAVVGAMALMIAGCVTKQHPAPVAVVPAQASVVEKDGFSATCPPGWKLIDKGGDYALTAVPASAGGGESNATIEIEVPNLPPHIPGFIPVDSVANGYVQDLKKRYPDQTTDAHEQSKLDGAPARRVVSSFQNHEKRELAVLAVHDDHVYVITGTCDAAGFDQTKQAFDALLASLKWTQSQ